MGTGKESPGASVPGLSRVWPYPRAVPTSALEVAPVVLYLVETADPHETVLDVGPGRGKYGLLLREYLNAPPRRIDAVEAEPSYVDDRLRALYDDVLVGDVLDVPAEALEPYDVVLLVDVIEHLEKADGLELLSRIPGRIVISTPVDFFSNGPGLPPSEEHRSHWTRADFDELDRPVEEDGSRFGATVVRLGPR